LIAASPNPAGGGRAGIAVMAMPLPDLVAARKTRAIQQDWVADGRNSLRFSCPLDIDGATVEAVQLRMTALQTRPDENVVAQLEFKRPGAKFRPACRIEWRPISSHSNGAIGPPEYRFKEITGSHYHQFDLNLN